METDMQRIQLDPVMLEEARARMRAKFKMMKLEVSPEQLGELSEWYEDFLCEITQGRQQDRAEDPRQMRLFD